MALLRAGHSAPEMPTDAAIPFHVADHERRLRKVEEEVEPVPVMIERIDTLTKRLEDISCVLWTIAGGLVLLIVSVLIAAAQIGGGG